MVQDKDMICWDCLKEIMHLGRCRHCQDLSNIRTQRWRNKMRGIQCTSCGDSLCEEDEGFTHCLNCREELTFERYSR